MTWVNKWHESHCNESCNLTSEPLLSSSSPARRTRTATSTTRSSWGRWWTGRWTSHIDCAKGNKSYKKKNEPHSSQVTNNHNVTYIWEINLLRSSPFFHSTPSASHWRKYPSWDIKVKVMYTSANLVWTPATLLNKISKTIWQQLRSRWSFIFSNGFCALHTLALRGSCWKSLCDVPQQTRIVRYDAVHAALH